MPLTATAAFPAVFALLAMRFQFRLGGHGGRFAIDFDDQHFAVVGERLLRGHEGRRPLAQTHDQRLDRFGRRRPSDHRPHDALGGGVAECVASRVTKSITRQLNPSAVMPSRASSGNQPWPLRRR